MTDLEVSERRRRVPRQEAARTARYRLEGERAAGWHDCQVRDLSILGVGVEITEPVRDDLVGHKVSLEVQTPSPLTGAMRTSRLTGVIRDVDAAADGGVRLGIQFVDELPWSERALLDAYDRMRMSW